MRVLLTDDEIVALAGSAGSSWPLPLLTVASDSRAIKAAAFRGLRSLIVRGLATPLQRGLTTIAPDLAGLIAHAAAATSVSIAHVSGMDAAGLAGASVAAFSADGRVVRDVVNVTGVHAIEDSNIADSRSALREFAFTRFSPEPDTQLSPSGCVMVAVSGIDRVARVRPGVVELGLAPTSDHTRFDPQESVTDFSAVDEILGGAH